MAFPMLEPEIDILVSKLLSFKTFGNFLRISFLWRRRKQRRKKRKIFGEDLSKKCQRYWEVSVLVSVSRLLPISGGFRCWFRRIWSREKSIGFGFGRFGLRKKLWVSVTENLVSKKESVSENLVSKKKFRFRKIWYRKKSLGIGFGQNFGIIIQCTAVARIFEFYLRSHNCLHLISLFKCESESESGARIGRCLKRLQDFSSKTSFHEPTTCLFSSFWHCGKASWQRKLPLHIPLASMPIWRSGKSSNRWSRRKWPRRWRRTRALLPRGTTRQNL